MKNKCVYDTNIQTKNKQNKGLCFFVNFLATATCFLMFGMFTFVYFVMLLKLNQILIFSLITFFTALILYPLYIRFLKKHKAGQQIREASVTGDAAPIFTQLHQHKSGTPTMGGGLFLIIMAVMVIASLLLKHFGIIKYSLFTRSETYILLFGFFSMGMIGFVDDWLNIK